MLPFDQLPEPTWPAPHEREKYPGVALYRADCLTILPQLGKGVVDAVVTDPPYGMNSTTANMNRGNANCRWALATAKSAWPVGGNEWDNEAPAIVPTLPGMSKECIVWGGNFFALPPQRGWLVWNKIIRNFQSSVCELAWTNIEAPVDAFDYSHGQLAHEGKEHPTQKPLPLMEWCIRKLKGQTILDPYMGSGTTGVACARTGRNFIGCELEPKYFDIAVKRISAELSRFPLFEQEAKAVQQELIA